MGGVRGGKRLQKNFPSSFLPVTPTNFLFPVYWKLKLTTQRLVMYGPIDVINNYINDHVVNNITKENLENKNYYLLKIHPILEIIRANSLIIEP